MKKLILVIFLISTCFGVTDYYAPKDLICPIPNNMDDCYFSNDGTVGHMHLVGGRYSFPAGTYFQVKELANLNNSPTVIYGTSTDSFIFSALPDNDNFIPDLNFAGQPWISTPSSTYCMWTWEIGCPLILNN